MIELLHASSLLVFSSMLGLSHALCLVRKPGRFTSVALAAIYDRIRGFSIGWAVLAVAWFVYARHGAGAREIAELVGMLLAAALVAVELWNHSQVSAEVRALAEVAQAPGHRDPVAYVDDQGCWQMSGLEIDHGYVANSARTAVWLFAGILVAALALFAVAASSAIGQGTSLLACLVVLASWVSLGVIAVDLCLDVLPGSSAETRVRECAIYYVQIFESWINPAVLVALVGAMLGGLLLWGLGEAPAAMASFGIWFLACVGFALVVNLLLRPAGLVNVRLPLPVVRNDYVARPPIWAWFFYVIHLVMALCLSTAIVASVLGAR